MPRRWAPIVGVDPLTSSCLFGVLSGGLSLVVPSFLGMTLALAVVATVAWWVRSSPNSPGGPPADFHDRGRRSVAPVVALAGGWIGFLLWPAFLSVGRGAVLGAALAVVRWAARSAGPLGGAPSG